MKNSHIQIMGWIVPGSVKMCKGEKITKSLQYTIYFLQGKPGFQFMEQRPVLDSQKHSRRVLPAAIDLSCTREKDRHGAPSQKRQ